MSHSILQPGNEPPQATPPAPVVGPWFADIQREFQRTEPKQMVRNLVFGSVVGGPQGTLLLYVLKYFVLLYECCIDACSRPHGEQNLAADLQGQDVSAEDSLSTDEYDCPSPDDISLPPLAETPESMALQSDVEESHSLTPRCVDIKQQSHHHLQDTGDKAGQQQGASSHAENCPTTASGPQSGTRSGSSLVLTLTPEKQHMTWFSLCCGFQVCAGVYSSARSCFWPWSSSSAWHCVHHW